MNSSYVFASLVFSFKKLSDFLNQSEYLESLASGLYNDYKILGREKAELADLLSGQKELKDELNDLKHELQAKNTLIQNQKEEKSELLKETKNQEIEYQKLISKIQIRQAEIQKEIFEL